MLSNQSINRPIQAKITVVEPACAADPGWIARPSRVTAVIGLFRAAARLGRTLVSKSFDDRLRSTDDIRKTIGGHVLGVIPKMPARRAHVGRATITHLDPRGGAAEAYRTLRTNVLGGGPCKSIVVTSPEAGDGKSVCASNLALALTQAGRSVLLIDADFRRPTQHTNLDLHDGSGLSDALRSPRTAHWAIQPSGIDGLDVLPCGSIPPNPSELIDGAAFAELIAELAQKYDHLIIDSPPVNLVTDAAVLGSKCEATVLVVRADRTTRQAAARAIETLSSAGARLVGTVVNDAPSNESYGVYGGGYYVSIDTPLRRREVYESLAGRIDMNDPEPAIV